MKIKSRSHIKPLARLVIRMSYCALPALTLERIAGVGGNTSVPTVRCLCQGLARNGLSQENLTAIAALFAAETGDDRVSSLTAALVDAVAVMALRFSDDVSSDGSTVFSVPTIDQAAVRALDRLERDEAFRRVETLVRLHLLPRLGTMNLILQYLSIPDNRGRKAA